MSSKIANTISFPELETTSNKMMAVPQISGCGVSFQDGFLNCSGQHTKKMTGKENKEPRNKIQGKLKLKPGGETKS